ncbi:MAG: glycosyl transferase family 1 [Candidatus Nealsonbacteria bacterium]|nr:MAG: glycosyl transferase family 1 [Candidatus Nealsonbacteria bacterium]
MYNVKNMLPKVRVYPKKIEAYQNFISQKQLREIKSLAEELKGLKVNMVNSTPRGGGVAEILKSLVPLMKGLGLKAMWYTIPGREDFFEITKKMHNALQGEKYEFPFAHRKRYLAHMERSAEIMQDMRADVWVIHDPQPAGVIQFLPRFYPAICRLHIDLTSPNHEVWDFVSGYLAMYDKVVVSSKEFVKPEIKNKKVIFPPAIDPLLPKNEPLSLNIAKRIIENFGINPRRPLVTQVSRFDPWKDPLGVIKAYKIAKKKIPNLQLAMVGFFMAQDDPEAVRVFNMVKKEAEKDQDIFLFADLNMLGSMRVSTFVNAIQVASDVIVQKSIAEGFGLTVCEAMWKGKPVIGGNVGGIKIQIEDGKNGFLVANYRETAKRIVQLLQNPELNKKMGQMARLQVKRNFLIPRLLRDYLKVFRELTLKYPRKKRTRGNSKIMY